MATKVIIQIQGNLYDFWECRSLERELRYNEIEERLDYLLVMNRQAIATNYSAVEFAYPTEELREKEYNRIKEQLDFFEGVLFLDAGMPVSALKAAVREALVQLAEDQQPDDFTDELEALDS